MATSYVALDQTGWASLEALLAKGQTNTRITPHVLKHLRSLDAKAMLVEDNFLNRDFTEAYANYYARTFRRHSKICLRLSFFSEPLSYLTEGLPVADAADRLQETASESFLGYLVLRPISQAPINEIVLLAPDPPEGFEGHSLVNAKFETHLLGAKMSVFGVPSTQQDSRIGACAQAAIWSVCRFFHARHHGPWMTTSDITKAALANVDHSNNVHLPAGSEFLTGNNMSAALRAAGREPLFYIGAMVDGKPNWGFLRPADIINRYIDSGIPVIVGLSTGQDVGHAVVAVGQILRQSVASQILPIRPTRAEFCEGFHVHDDQLGSNACMPISSTSAIKETDYCVDDNVQYLIVPLPSKVYLPAEKAEIVAWDVLKAYTESWQSIQGLFPLGGAGTSEALGAKLCDMHAANKVVARTYLTYGWKYKHRAVRNRHPEALKALLGATDLPRFVYVTEFSTLDQCEGKHLEDRRVISHCVVDATAKSSGIDPAIIFHAPGFCRRMIFDSANELVPAVSAIIADTTYFPKVRGHDNSLLFEASSTVD